MPDNPPQANFASQRATATATSVSTPAVTPASAATSAAQPAAGGGDLGWVWREVRKRVFIKLPFSRPIAEALEAVVPITIDGDTFVCGMTTVQYPMSGYLNAEHVRKTIESILQQAGGQRIHFELIEGTTLEDWNEIKTRRSSAHEAVIAIAEQHLELHNYEAILNQVVAEIRQRITATSDRIYPQVRIQAMFDVVPMLSDTADMLFPDRDAHDARRAMARAIDRVANFLDVPPLTLAMEIERYYRANARPRPQAEVATNT
jgi:hypothetical protein